ncbi:GNAT family N-acetyltransferase [Enterococcus asini]|uniref:GNAT family N-acetyltransferase n=1 Tax=Enterococcus asini TaxID=57732 RepID=UPI00288C65CB|nr:GNAT family N-acetyltransferase [Enterococcus asini]MDT2757173.1 GNAT family N-acetyltransferase [Enterococcus asini]
MEKEVSLTLLLAENQLIETPRLLLRPVGLRDAKDMFEYASDEETTRFIFPTHQSLADTRTGIAEYFLSSPLGKYAIEERQSGKMIGTIDLRVDKEKYCGELGYALNKAYWGQGLAPEAAMALLSLGFDRLGLVSIQAIHDVRNPSSGKVMEKIGMKKIGQVPCAQKMKGQVVDTCLCSISMKEWQRHIL